MKLLDFYNSVLNFSGLEANKEGFISAVIGEERSPVTIDGKRLVLPTQEQLKSGTKEKIVFHPLTEMINRGESEVITKLRSVLNIKLNYTFGILSLALINISERTDLHKHLDPDQKHLLIALKDVDANTASIFTKLILNATKKSAEKCFVNIYLKRGGTINEKRYSRVGFVNFPFMEEFAKGEDLYGVKLRQKDRLVIKALYDYILPNWDKENFYSRGSDSDTAPFLDALLKTSLAIASRYNDVLVEFKDYIDDAETFIMDTDFADVLFDLNSMATEIRTVPMQSGNEGRSKVEPVTNTTNLVNVQPELPAITNTAPPAVQPPMPNYGTTQTPSVANNPGTVPWNPQAMFQQQPQPPVQNYCNPGYQQPMQPQPVNYVKENGLVDFNAFMRVNPGVAANLNNAFNTNTMQPNYPMQQPQQRLPSWATPDYPVSNGYYNNGNFSNGYNPNLGIVNSL